MSDKKSQKVVCVLGMHRSGTSLVSRVLNIMGVSLGPEDHLMVSRPDNPRGFWESRVLSEINDTLLLRYNGTWDDPPHFPQGWQDAPDIAPIKEDARLLIEKDFGNAPIWGFKDPRTCLTLPFWQAVIPEMSYVVVLRNPLDVAYSLETRDGLSIGEAVMLWTRYVCSSIRHTAGKKRMFIFYEDFMDDMDTGARGIAEFLGLRDALKDDGAVRAMKSFVEKGLQHHSSSLDRVMADQRVHYPAKSLYFALRLYVDSLKEKGFNDATLSDAQIDSLADSLSGFANGYEAKEREIQGLTEEIRKIGDINASIRDKDSKILNLERLVLVRDQYAMNLEASIRLKDEAIKGHEKELSGFRADDAEKDALIKALRDSIRGAEEHIRNLNEAIQAKDSALQSLSSLSSSRALGLFRRLRDGLLPRGSKRRRLIKSLVKKKTINEALIAGGVEVDLGRPFEVGMGNFLYLKGWCYHTTREIKRLFVVAEGRKHEVRDFGHFRLDAFKSQHNISEFTGNSLLSGFWALMPLEAGEEGRAVTLSLYAELDNGESCAREWGRVMVEPKALRDPVKIHGIKGISQDTPLITICMATYNPDARLFKRQVESIISQTYRNWVCVITDDCSEGSAYAEIRAVTGSDQRFIVLRNERNLGHYYNFERALRCVPEEASYIAFSDQDDLWRPDKLERLVRAFDGDDVMLAYSDMRIVDDEGRVINDSYWVWRRNNFTELDLLITANTVTGAAAMFRAGLLNYILPFPQHIGDAFHDNFIATVALSQGRIAYLDEPLYDYCQHSANVIGQVRGNTSGVLSAFVSMLRYIRENMPLRNAFRKYLLQYLDCQSGYYRFYHKRVLYAKVIGRRCAPAGHEKRRAIERFSAMEASIVPILAMYLRNKLMRKGRVTIGLDWLLLRDALVTKALNAAFRAGRFKFVEWRSRRSSVASATLGA